MVKYIFYMLLGLFLISKVVSASGDIKECKVLHTMDARHAPEKRYILSEGDFKQYASGVQHESYHDKADQDIEEPYSLDHCQNREVSEDLASRRENDFLFIRHKFFQLLLQVLCLYLEAYPYLVLSFLFSKRVLSLCAFLLFLCKH